MLRRRMATIVVARDSCLVRPGFFSAIEGNRAAQSVAGRAITHLPRALP